jgi:hypothetical protein
MIEFWDLPYPGRFLGDITDALSEGLNCVVFLPDEGPSDFKSMLQRKAGVNQFNGGIEWLVDDGGESSSPVEFLFFNLLSRNPDPLESNAIGFCTALEYMTSVIAVEISSQEACAAWRDFIGDYQSAYMDKEALERAPILLVVRGQGPTSGFMGETALRIFHWNGRVTEIDMNIYSHFICQDLEGPRWKKRLIIALIGKLAKWDKGLSEHLRREYRLMLDNPLNLLTKWGSERYFNRTVSDDDRWNVGLEYDYEEVNETHSVVFALQEDKAELKRLIWKAQMSVLFPLIEEHRTELIKLFSGFLDVPFHPPTRKNTIKDKSELELGHIQYQLTKKKHKLSSKKFTNSQAGVILEFIEKLKDIRNQLAHMRPASSGSILDKEFSMMFDGFGYIETASEILDRR